MTLTDDDLGDRLYAALQQVSPLATDPVPPPRFAADSGSAPTDVDLDVVELGSRRASRRPRRVVAAVSLLTAAAAAAVAVTLTTDLGRDERPTPAGPVASRSAASDAPTADSPGTPVTGVVPGILVPWRCTAPAGATLAASIVRDTVSPQVWKIGAGVTCAPYPADVDRFVISDDGRGVSVADPVPATFGISEGCVTASTRTSSSAFDLAFVSKGEPDYLEFFGDSCRLLLP